MFSGNNIFNNIKFQKKKSNLFSTDPNVLAVLAETQHYIFYAYAYSLIPYIGIFDINIHVILSKNSLKRDYLYVFVFPKHSGT